LILTLFLSAVVLPGGFLLAESKHATKEEAQAMATKAADLVQKEGADRRLQPSTQAVTGVTAISMCSSSTRPAHGGPVEHGQS
jgi:hypothetical protein